MKPHPLKTWLNRRAADGRELTATWDCGGDDRLVSFFENGQVVAEGEEHLDHLEDLLIEKLDLPNAGDRFHEGSGQIGVDRRGRVVMRCDFDHYFSLHGYPLPPAPDHEKYHLRGLPDVRDTVTDKPYPFDGQILYQRGKVTDAFLDDPEARARLSADQQERLVQAIVERVDPRHQFLREQPSYIHFYGYIGPEEITFRSEARMEEELARQKEVVLLE